MKKVLIGKKTEIFIICSVLILFGVFLAYNIWNLLPSWKRNAHEDKITKFSDVQKSEIAMAYDINLDNVKIVSFAKVLRETGDIIYRLDLSGIEDVDNFISTNKGLELNKPVKINEKYYVGYGLSREYPNIFVDNDKITIVTVSSNIYEQYNITDKYEQIYEYCKDIERTFEKIYENQK